MKVETKQKILESTVYTCEYCGKESWDGWSIEQCEKTHKRQIDCKHNQFEYVPYIVGNDLRGVVKRCKSCQFSFGVIEWKLGYWDLVWNMLERINHEKSGINLIA